MVHSPCINLCSMDRGTGLCLGCFRTLDEIAGWSSSREEVRLEILAQVEKRRQEHTPLENGLSCNCDDSER